MQLEERIKLFDDAVRFIQPSRTPLAANIWTWKIFDAGHKLSEALYDWDLMYKIVCEFHERYQFDRYSDLGVRNTLTIADAMGGGRYILDDARDALNVKDEAYILDDEYPELIADIKKFYWTKILPRKYPGLADADGFAKFEAGRAESNKFGEYRARISSKFLNDYQIPTSFTFSATYGFETLFNHLRGMQGLSIDMRRRKPQVLEAIEVINRLNGVDDAGIRRMADAQKNPNSIFDATVGLLGHSMLSPAQFGETYWPWMKKVIDAFAEKGKTITMFVESDSMRFADYFQDIPKGVVTMHLELDDVWEMRAKVPNVCITGGMTTDLLGKADAKTCVDAARRLIDELSPGFILSQNKMVSFRNDVTRENLLAVNEFARTHVAGALQ